MIEACRVHALPLHLAVDSSSFLYLLLPSVSDGKLDTFPDSNPLPTDAFLQQAGLIDSGPNWPPDQITYTRVITFFFILFFIMFFGRCDVLTDATRPSFAETPADVFIGVVWMLIELDGVRTPLCCRLWESFVFPLRIGLINSERNTVGICNIEGRYWNVVMKFWVFRICSGTWLFSINIRSFV